MSGRGSNGKKLWIQTYVNIGNGKYLTNLIKRQDSSIKNITWLSPLANDNYREYNTCEILNYLKEKDIKVNISNDFLDMWKDYDSVWDAI